MKSKRSPELNRRYRLHQLIKKKWRYSASQKTVFVIPDELEYISEGQMNLVYELRDRFGYNIQTEIR